MQGLARKLNAAVPPMVGKMEWVMHARVPIIKLEHTSGMSGPAPAYHVCVVWTSTSDL